MLLASKQPNNQFFTLFGDPNEVRNTKFELNSLSMKDNGRASTYIAQFQTLQSRINWNKAGLTFHFRKGLLSRITDQLALTDKIRSHKKANSTPSNSKNEYASKYKKNFPEKPFAPSALTLAPRSRKPTKISLVLNKEAP
ncbi:uncharacterized protein VP01_2155g1 [Puccinia sorghi]|uniref:Retrotransposon gag domain-containing protein n=1 Tax=Puccinia sorghi TaxID=27349 RepID=A0A0L6VA82_9BASI|nr:uncharacterized protein VP01_2155g1 [Puccinia sorghi]